MSWRCSLAVILLLACQSKVSDTYDKRQENGNLWEPKADIEFVLDASDTMGKHEWEALRTMLLSLVKRFIIGPSAVQVGVVSYGDGPHNEFFLNEVTSATQLVNRINALSLYGGNADAAEAFRFAYRTSFSTAHGMRDDVPHIIVHITDDPSADAALLRQEAENAHEQGVTIFNIGVGTGVEFEHLAQVASDPSSRYVLQADNFASLSNLVPLLSSRINNEIPVSAQALPDPNSCLTKADLVLLIDSSSSVGQEDFGHLEDYVKDLIVQLPIGQNQVQLGLVQFAGHPRLEFPLNMYSDRMDLLKAVENLQFMGGGTNTGDALQYVMSNVYTKDGGARTSVPRVVIVVTDGQSVDSARTVAAANSARQHNIGLIAVGVGSNVNDIELQNIANDPDSGHVFKVTNYTQLQTMSTTILQAACTMNSMITPEPTLPAGVTATADICVDKLDNCDSYAERTCTDYASWARENCQKHCGICQTAADIECEDKEEHCETYGEDLCTSDQNRQWALENCKRFCGYCDSHATTLGFYGKCLYKGLTYVQSERWEDGCDYECVCEDAEEGKYRCYNRCPVYHNLPAQCTLVGVPNECCLQPVCNFNQQLTTSKVEAGVSYNAQNISVCEYQGNQYFQGQTWEFGCDLKCICTNASLGAYECQSYCPDYPALPKECRLVQKPGQCCQEPVCEFYTQTGSFTGFGTVSGLGVGMMQQSGGLCEDDIVDCEDYGRDACTEYPAWARINCAKFCGLCSPDSLTPGPNDVCYYHGEKYREGDKWQISCDTECVCEDGIYGYYRCYSSCPTYLNLPAGCTVAPQNGQCCPAVECQQGTFYPSSTNAISVGNGGGLVVRNGQGQMVEAVPTLPSGVTVPPGTLGGSAGLSNIQIDGCLFNGNMYIQSQQWHDGCNHTCVCQNASTGHFSCRERCPKYNNVPDSCGSQQDPNDPCCTMPDCPASLGYVPIPVYSKGLQGIGAVMSPNLPDLVSGLFTARFTLVYNGFTVAAPTAPSATLKPGGLDYCEYKNQRYSQGETWEDGCDYNCVCEDASSGSWRCVDKCEKYVDLPKPYCHLEPDPALPCCQRPVCNFLVGHGQIEGNNTLPTTPTTTVETTTAGYWEPKCVYKGVEYAVGQSLYDGCSLKCKCDDADQNIYTCITRCPSYPAEYDNCQQLPDPKDPSCCVVPVCAPTAVPYLTPYPGATQSPYLIPHQIPIIPPGVVTGGNSTGYCEYNGVHYSQDDLWEDGCDFTCVCEDAQTGRYKCTEKCKRFGSLPSDCRLVTDFTNPCCMAPSCTGIATGFTDSGQIPTGSSPTPSAVCVYNNAQFLQGQQWQEGCSKVCRCEDADNGLYVCTDRCPQYDDLPPECTLVSDPDDACCLKPKCVPGLLYGSTLAPKPYLIPTLVPGKIVGTAVYPTPSVGPSGETPTINFCIYAGYPYAKGQRWQDGCDYDCVCEDPTAGRYECTERCPRYAAIPAGCVLVKDAADPCCQRPVCSPDFSTPVSVQTQVPVPGSTQKPPFGSAATPATGSTGSPMPLTTAKPEPKDVCVYKTEYYTQGQTWYDGCDFFCTCENAKDGVYRCSERCPKYAELPSECALGPDPADPLCCQRPLCPFEPKPGNTSGYLIPHIKPGVVTGGSATPSPMPYPTPGPDGSTLRPPTAIPKNVCIYNSQEYTQGQKWADGCSYDCECVNAAAGFYQCTEKCVKLSSIPAQCTLVTNPNNPCCQIPYCDSNKPTPEPQTTLSPLPQTTGKPFIGPDGSTLSPPTVQTPATSTGRCVYGGVPFRTGESWEDGCDLKCVCEDEQSGAYRCDQRCLMYELTSGCILVTDPSDACCRVPSCAPVTPFIPTPNTQQPPTTLVPATGPDGSTLNPPTLAPTQGPNVGPVKPPFLIPTGVPGKGVGIINRPNTNPSSNESVGCLFNQVVYGENESWDDGCDRRCKCLNATAGTYECTDRCVKYLNMAPGCQLVPDPADSCCKTPLCQTISTSSPIAVPTAGPQVTPVSGQTMASPNTAMTGGPTPSVQSTLEPKKLCVYKGQYYVEGQQWYDGCDKACVCDDGLTNYYRCTDRCKTYSDVPSWCQLVASPDDPTCCMVPQCVPTPGPFGYPTAGPGATPTVYTNAPGMITGIAATPSPRPGYPTPSYRNACVYNGHEYKEGQQWQDGCEYNCVCLNETSGLYKCTERCSVYPLVPSQCNLVPDPMDYCCKQLECDSSKPTPDPFSPTPKTTREPNPNLHTTLTPMPIDVTTVSPQPGVGIPSPTYQPPTLVPQYAVCVYNGVPYHQGDTWNVGCDQVCTCDDSTNNYYTCADRCPSYTNLPANCNMKVDPDDACCRVPECYMIPTPGPDVTPGVSPGQVTVAPSPIPVGVPGVIIGSPNTGNPTTETGCIKDGVKYKVGDTWQDGCQYICQCLDNTGRYKCTERCAPYPSIPDYCVMGVDPLDVCCQKPLCYEATPSPESTISPATLAPGVSTPVPTPFPKEVCVYKGTTYTEGQQWYDGCALACLCEDGKTGFYRCSERCATYPTPGANCKFVPDTRDPTCCEVPECDTPNVQNLTGHVGVITGFGKPLTPLPPTAGGFLTAKPPAEVCLYNGHSYNQGQMWQDGCTFKCECYNASLGQYRCTDRCPHYPQSAVSFCTMVRDPTDPCCMKPDCTATPTPQPVSTPGTGSVSSPSLTNATPQVPPLAGTPFPTIHPTLVPGIQFCVYKGIPYSHGQTWNDGCDKTCRCEDVVTGQVNCDDRCPSYTQIAASCQLVTDPKDSCCQVPDCPLQPGTNNTTIVNGTRGVITGSSLPPNHRGPLTRKNVCIYHGHTYQEGEVWDDGCSFTCECIDGSQGKYSCKERCENIVQLPPTCSMIKDENDQCCMKPYCLPWPNRVPTPEPNATPKTPTQKPGGSQTPNVSPTPAPGVTPSPEACLYKGQAYHQGQQWYDGCSAKCVCEDASVGFYRCQERCAHYTPDPGCLMVPDPNDPSCCEVPQCGLVTPTPQPGVTPTPGIIDVVTLVPGKIIGIGKVPTPMPTEAPTPGPDGSIATPTPVTRPDGSIVSPTPRVTTGCYYKGITYREKDVWEDGCDYVCECLDGTTGKYSCSEKCPILPQLPAGRCVLVQDPQEPCCMTPYCDLGNPTPFPNGTPTPYPSMATLVPGTGPTSIPTATPTPGPIGIPTGYCVYNGAYYRQGQQWEDGCSLQCKCDNATTGFYTCKDRCKSFGELSDGCVLKVDPTDSCCLVPDCPVLTPEPVTGVPGLSTPKPSFVYVGGHQGSFTGTSGVGRPTGTFGSTTGFTNGCVYNSTLYQQNAVWNDGCDYICVCIDALRGKYQCSDRCKSYYFLPPVCKMEADPDDACCQQARCYPGGLATPPTPPSSIVITGQTVTGPAGTGSTLTPAGQASSHTGINITPNTPTGFGGNGSINITPNPPTGFGGNGSINITPNTPTGFGGNGSINITPNTPTGFGGNGSINITPNTPTGFGGNGSINITPNTPTGFGGNGSINITPNTPTGFGGNGSINITPNTPTGFGGNGSINITPNTPTGFGGNGSINITPNTPTGFGGNGSINITPNTPTGFGGNGSINITPNTPTGFGGNGSINITPNTPTGFGGSVTALFGSTNSGFTGTRGSCVYKGIQYHTGDSWDDGCDLHCICDDDVKGLYTCTYNCPAYSSLPQFCHLQPDPTNVCCKKPSCMVQGTQLVPQIGGTPTLSPTLDPSVTNVIPLGTHIVITGSSQLPGVGVKEIYGGRSSCLYKNVEYVPGQSWDDNCTYTCTCIGDDVGLYRCISKCPSYPALPSYCTLSSIPGKCCPSLSCEVPHVGTYNPLSQLEPNAKPTPGPDGIYPTPQPSVDPQLILGVGVGTIIGGTSLPGGGARVPGGFINNLGGIRDKCIYELKMYNQGEMWEVGCNYTCKCLDSLTGFYECTERCVSYDSITLPPVCKLVQNPSDACCQTPSCPDPTNTGQQITNITQIQQMYPIVGSYVGGVSGFRPGYVPHGSYGTIGGTRNGCVYKNVMHPEGSSWEDGCDFDCKCIDGTTGVFQCTAKCVSYSLLPPACKLVDVEGECCQSLHCDPITTSSPCRDNIDNCEQYRHSGCVGAYEGWARAHCALYCGYCTPDYTTTPLPCEDKVQCENYADDICTSVVYADWALSNCRKYCNLCSSTTPATTVWTTPSSGCFDAISYCEEYGPGMCSDPLYRVFVLNNCKKYCRICNSTDIGSTTEAACEDTMGSDTCALYGKSACGGQFFGWALHNCRKYCDLCGDVTQPTRGSSTSTPQPVCADTLSNCREYDRQYCTGAYLAWAADNCAATCNLCNYEGTTVKAVVEPGWIVLLKGVTGGTGDLWQLWNSTSTANENVPQAQYLTNQYPGHYKPQVTNQWSACHFEKVKVTVLKDGIEKANIIFDVRNLAKNDWFKPENVISSTFNDLPTTAGSFGMAKNPFTGNEFAVGEFNDCKGSGWIIVSTNQDCSYNSGAAPQFYYSLRNTVAQLTPDQLGEGDVFAILAQGGNCMNGVLSTQRVFTNMNNGCFYKGHMYGAGENWLDGCDLNCTCQDAATGQYYCHDRCPTYNNLPSECSLEAKEGECCPELKCTIPIGDGCLYTDNKIYAQGATWQDGCDYDCTCHDGHTGSYSCTTICQDWSSLSSACHMEEPAPGMCCPRPVCPPSMTVKFDPR